MNHNNAYSFEEGTHMDKGDQSHAAVIHTTLPMEDLIGLFESEISSIINYDSFEYENSENASHIFRGTPKLHKCHYKISIAELELGQITLTRNIPFDEGEIDLIEGALGALMIHLSNAVDYQSRLGDKELNVLRVDNEYSNLD